MAVMARVPSPCLLACQGSLSEPQFVLCKDLGLLPGTQGRQKLPLPLFTPSVVTAGELSRQHGRVSLLPGQEQGGSAAHGGT